MNEVFVNNSGLEFKVIDKVMNERTRRYAYMVKFTDSKSTRIVQKNNIVKGKVKDYYSPSAYGIGYIGEFDKSKFIYWKEAKGLWRNMIKRCYYENDARGYYGHAFVSARWLCFANFLEDLIHLEGFNGWINKLNYELDKDFKVLDNDTYSRELCQFIPASLNRSYTSRTK